MCIHLARLHDVSVVFCWDVSKGSETAYFMLIIPLFVSVACFFFLVVVWNANHLSVI